MVNFGNCKGFSGLLANERWRKVSRTRTPRECKNEKIGFRLGVQESFLRAVTRCQPVILGFQDTPIKNPIRYDKIRE